MHTAYLEHLNLTVSNPRKTADLLCKLFDWTIRWSGNAKNSGHTVHVGDKDNGGSYLALYSHPDLHDNECAAHTTVRNLNHIGVVVERIDELEQKVTKLGLQPFSHGDYEPGRRFYFMMDDEIEVEAISYAPDLEQKYGAVSYK